MTPEEFIGHKAFRTVRSERWPVEAMPCFASFLQFRDGTEFFFLRGPVACGRRLIADLVAEELYGCGEACHRCLYEHSHGRYTDAGEYVCLFGTTQRQGTESPWGVLCKHCRAELAKHCRAELAKKATSKWKKRLLELGFHPLSSDVSEWMADSYRDDCLEDADQKSMPDYI